MKDRFTQFSLTIAVCLYTFNVMAQNTLFFDDFSDANINEWTLEVGSADYWTAGELPFVGAEAPGLHFRAIGASDPLGKSRLISPVINTSGYSTLYLSFFHIISLSQEAGISLSIETTSNGGATWNPVWQEDWTSLQAYNYYDILTITTEDVGSETFQFSFKYNDEASPFFFTWGFDNISLSDEAISYDVLPYRIVGLESSIHESDDVMISSLIRNYGLETVSFDAVLEILDGSNVVFTSTIPVVNLAYGEEFVVNFEAWAAIPGSYTARVTTLLSSEENTSNDQINSEFVVFALDEYCIPQGNCEERGIDAFEFAGISNIESGCSENGFGDFTAMQGTAQIGSTYTANITSDNGIFMNTSIWIDFNQNSQFESSELILSDAQIPAFSTLSVDIQIPWSAETGIKRMRVASQFFNSTATDPCAPLATGGEYEDYMIELTGSTLQLDAATLSIDMYQAYEQGTITPIATVVNQGIETASFPVTLTIDGAYSSTKNVTDLALGESMQIEFDPWAAIPDEYTIEVSAVLDGDLNTGNDVLSQIISIAEVAPFKMVLGEEGTGTWCGACPRGTVYMDSMATKYPDTWIGIAVHNGDPMANIEYDANIKPLINYAFPGAVVNRGAERLDPVDLEEFYNRAMEFIALADIAIENKAFNEETKELTFTLTSNFVSTVSDVRFSAVLIENNVTGTGPSWAQANYYSGGSEPMGGYENLPNPVPAEDMVYDHVGRAIIGGFAGVAGSLPPTVNYGETHSYDFSTIIDEESWDLSNMKVVGLLINNATGEIINSTLDNVLSEVTDVETATKSLINVYPNPAKNEITVSNIDHNCHLQLYNSNGQLLMEKQNVIDRYTLDISNFISGVYFIKLTSKQQTITKKVEILK
ncbi:MAG: T9SS type A sorting domain-containing protein [Chitinophagales bacterium]|nr:T9SS type A sorting domain-containing protein [Chitinophagales bacterium]